jgi:hypothetical protein
MRRVTSGWNKRVKGSKQTELQVLQEVERITGITPPELEGLPELPECADQLWIRYFRISATRTCGMSSVNPIQYSEILAWSILAGIRLKEWEINAIITIDNCYLYSVSEEAK